MAVREVLCFTHKVPLSLSFCFPEVVAVLHAEVVKLVVSALGLAVRWKYM